MKITKSMRILALLLVAVMVFSLFSCMEDVPTDESSEAENVTTNAPKDDEDDKDDETEPTATESADTTPEATESEENVGCSHSWVEATCTTPKTCSACGAIQGKAAGHDWKDADCNSPKTCSGCGITDGVALGHTWVEADCDTPKTCTVCNATEGKALGHTFADAACATPKTCTVCNVTEGEALGHTWVDADCTTPKTCSVCNSTEGEALGHDWADADCTTAKTCKVCKVTEGEALGHNEETVEGKDATCTENGFTDGTKCAKCGEIIKAQETIPATGHKDENSDYKCDVCAEELCTEHEEEAVEGKDPTCTENGLTAGSKCAKCGEVIEAQEIIPATGHDFADANCTTPKTCNTCGATEGEALGHDWADANCDTPKTCNTCGATEGEALGHDWADADCTTAKTCKVCKVTEGDALGHTWVDANCTTAKTCKVCKVTEGEALGHNEETVEGKDATCTENGLTDGKKCAKCGEIIKAQETIPAGHTWLPATLDAPKKCSACGITEGGYLEKQQDNIFTAEDIFAAYKANLQSNFTGELITENGVTFFRAKATAAKEGTLVLNSGANTVDGVGKYFVVVYRNKSAAINRIQLGINSAGKTNNAGGATPFLGISISNEWKAVYFSTGNPVDLSSGAGYISVDVFDTDNSNNIKTQVGDVMEIALIAMVDNEQTAKNTVGQYCGNIMKFPYTVNTSGIKVNGTTIKDSAVIPSLSATDKAIEIDLSGVAIGGFANNCLEFGGGWAVTRGGWDYYEYKIIDADGNATTLTLTDAVDFPSSSTTLPGLLNTYASYGSDCAVGGNLFSYYKINLSGYEGKTVTVEVYGVSNFGQSYKLANFKNVNVPKWDNVFTASDFYAAHKMNPNSAFTSQLLTDENGLTYFRATAAQAGAGRLVLNTGSQTVPDVGKTFVLVYRNNTSNVKVFNLYLTAAGNTNSASAVNPFTAFSKTDEWKVLIFKTGNPIDLTNGAGYVAVDIFNANGIAGDVVDIALFAAVADEATAWETVKETIGENLALPYTVNVGGVVVNGTTYKDATVLPNGQQGNSAPIEVDLSSVNMPASSNLANCFKLGSGWAVTRSGWDYYLCKITTAEGRTETIRISEGSDFSASSGTLSTLKNNFESSYGADFAVGGNIMPTVYMYVNLTGFEGENVTLQIIGVSNYGMEYALMNIRNVKVPGTAQYNIDDEFVSFVDYTKTSNRKSVDIKNGTTYAVSFTVPTGEQVNLIRANLTNENALNNCSINVSVYSFDGNYASSVATTHLYTKTYTSVIKSADLEVKLGAGNYIMVVKYIAADGSVFSTVMVDNAWSVDTLPAEYAKYNMVSYKNGAVDSSSIIYGGILVETVGAVVPADDVIDATFADTDAKVIVIAGQSNAAGTTFNSYLQKNGSAEQYAKYQNGFPNVKIYFTCGSGSNGVSHTNVVEEFVEVKIGQGYVSYTFGPELALAAYLAENYPDEQFYIIKYAIGGTAMDIQWNALDANKRQCLDELEAKIDSGLALLEAEGLNPEILAFIWMQGEGDANPASRTAPYYNYQKALIGELRERYADYAVDGDVPFIDTEISNDGFWAASYMINDAKNDIAEESGRNYIIDTNYYGLTTRYENNDLAHYDSTSMILLGQLYAKKICSIYGNSFN